MPLKPGSGVMIRSLVLGSGLARFSGCRGADPGRGGGGFHEERGLEGGGEPLPPAARRGPRHLRLERCERFGSGSGAVRERFGSGSGAVRERFESAVSKGANERLTGWLARKAGAWGGYPFVVALQRELRSYQEFCEDMLRGVLWEPRLKQHPG